MAGRACARCDAFGGLAAGERGTFQALFAKPLIGQDECLRERERSRHGNNLCCAMLKWASLGMIVICDHLRGKSSANERVARVRVGFNVRDFHMRRYFCVYVRVYVCWAFVYFVGIRSILMHLQIAE